VHLELVTALTTDAFLATFRRFVSRRGKPQSVFSDNGKNFVGANNELQQLGVFLKNESKSIAQQSIEDQISWKFIPSYSPNFGGLWEAGIKSCKTHLKKILGNSTLTFKGLYTTLTQVKAVLNSRPLIPLSSSPEDYDCLTPSHFLIGRRLTSLPDPSLSDIPIGKLTRYQHLQMLLQHFWKRWSCEYLTELQSRAKWHSEKDNIKIGDLVLIRDKNLPPLQWNLGRVVQTIHGPDNHVRVVQLDTRGGKIKRAISQICRLPLE